MLHEVFFLLLHRTFDSCKCVHRTLLHVFNEPTILGKSLRNGKKVRVAKQQNLVARRSGHKRCASVGGAGGNRPAFTQHACVARPSSHLFSTGALAKRGAVRAKKRGICAAAPRSWRRCGGWPLQKLTLARTHPRPRSRTASSTLTMQRGSGAPGKSHVQHHMDPPARRWRTAYVQLRAGCEARGAADAAQGNSQPHAR